MKRRLLISMLCLSLASMAPAPLSACAMLMASPTDCAPAQAVPDPTASHCEQAAASKGTNQKQLQAAASELPCCKLTAAPVPDAGAGLGKVNFTQAAAWPESGPQAIAGHALERPISQTDLEQFTSPPDRQPLLCTFLI
jgi:hypothetical protein